jgi:hypothetical protein
MVAGQRQIVNGLRRMALPAPGWQVIAWRLEDTETRSLRGSAENDVIDLDRLWPVVSTCSAVGARSRDHSVEIDDGAHSPHL